VYLDKVYGIATEFTFVKK